MSGNFRSGRRPEPKKPPKVKKKLLPIGKPVRPDELTEEEAWYWDTIIEKQDHLGESDTAMAIACCEMWNLYKRAVELAIHKPRDASARLAVLRYSKQWSELASKLGADAGYRHRAIIIEPEEVEEKPKEVDNPLVRFGIVSA